MGHKRFGKAIGKKLTIECVESNATAAEVRLLSRVHSCDVLCLQETWNRHPDDLPHVAGFVMVSEQHRDRAMGKGGGIALCIRDTLTYNGCEDIVVRKVKERNFKQQRKACHFSETFRCALRMIGTEKLWGHTRFCDVPPQQFYLAITPINHMPERRKVACTHPFLHSKRPLF